MAKQQNAFQKIGQILTTSSETFMLVALLSIFALPFVIAKNLEPAVREAEKTAQNSKPARLSTTISSSVVNAEDSKNVLGAFDIQEPFWIKENTEGLKFLQESKPEIIENRYTLEFSANQKFDKLVLVTLKNNSSEKHFYKANVTSFNNQKNLMLKIDTNSFLLGKDSLPQTFTLEAGQEIQIGIGSTNTNAQGRFSVELLQNK